MNGVGSCAFKFAWGFQIIWTTNLKHQVAKKVQKYGQILKDWRATVMTMMKEMNSVYLFALPHFDLSRNEGVAAYDALMKKHNLVYGQA